ncbi:hypothetical protein F4774DRAFT_269044 [Daldinia eschscholtzii]|nr:hypothetical protein F4774DRAFT_269044 [Daldinia eschscholtzii]
MVLLYTDLVMPLSVVHWNSLLKYHLISDSCGEVQDPPYDRCHPNEHRHCADAGYGASDRCLNPCQHDRCSDCLHYICRFKTCSKKSKGECACITGCFCSREHAAYSANCRCWVSPTSLFLVNKAFRGSRHVSHRLRLYPHASEPSISRDRCKPRKLFQMDVCSI